LFLSGELLFNTTQYNISYGKESMKVYKDEGYKGGKKFKLKLYELYELYKLITAW